MLGKVFKAYDIRGTYPDQVNEIWKLYNGAVSGGGSLMNLTPVKPMAPPPLEPASKPKADEKP